MSLVVRVPVLSVQIIVVHPKVSTEGNFLTKALFLDNLLDPKAKQV